MFPFVRDGGRRIDVRPATEPDAVSVAALAVQVLAAADGRARAASGRSTWPTVWEGNANARAFYARCGFEDVGEAFHVVEERAYRNRVLVRPVEGAGRGDGGA